MPSFNLSNVDDANFNGSTVETINLNGSEIWQKELGQYFTTSNRHKSVRGDKMAPDHDQYGYCPTHPTLSLYDRSAGYGGGTCSPASVNGYTISGIWDWDVYNGGTCAGGGIHFWLEGNNVPAPGHTLIIDGVSFSFASAGNYHAIGNGWGRSNDKAGGLYMTAWHWHGQGKGLMRGGSSTVVII